VRPSSLHGLGGFAVQRIRRGTRIAEYAGERMTMADVDARYADQPGDHTFIFHVGDDVYVDASRNGNDSRFINHSCEPNCESDVIDGRVYIVALRDIEVGEELTYDYALEPEEDLPSSGERPYACRCGSPRCRGTMLEVTSILQGAGEEATDEIRLQRDHDEGGREAGQDGGGGDVAPRDLKDPGKQREGHRHRAARLGRGEGVRV
jgi:hypothetical protein